MGIDHVVAVVHMPGQVQLADAFRRQITNECPGVEAMVARTHVNVVHVQQQLAPRQVSQRVEKFPLGKLVGLGTYVAGDVLQHQRALQYVLHLAHTGGHVVQTFFGVGQRQQVMQLVGAATAPAQVIGHPRRLDTLGELLDLLQVNVIIGLGWTLAIVVFAAFGWLGAAGAMIAAVLHNLSTLLVLGNAGRLLRFQEPLLKLEE